MKKNVARFVLVLLAVLVMFPTSWASAQPDDSLKFASESSADGTKQNVVPVCDPNLVDISGVAASDIDPNDLNLPCTVDIFIISSDAVYSPLGVTRNFTCGGTVKSGTGQIIGKIWEEVGVTWWGSRYYDFSAARKQWTINNWYYGWQGLWGPSPKSGSGVVGKTDIKSGGWFTYYGVRKYNITIKFTVDGTQANPKWGCSWTN